MLRLQLLFTLCCWALAHTTKIGAQAPLDLDSHDKQQCSGTGQHYALAHIINISAQAPLAPMIKIGAQALVTFELRLP